MTPLITEMTSRLSEIVGPLLGWYRQNARILPWRENTDPYRVWVSEIMLQQTRVTAAIPYYERFLSALPDVAALAACPEDRLMKLWEGLGYYSRARNLQKSAGIIMEHYGGMLPASFEELQKLPGIGEYTAGAIGSIAFGLPCPAVDGNVLRVGSRLLGSRRDIADPRVKKDFSAALAEIIPRECPGDFNQALMELGACVCLPGGDPLCGSCPLEALCQAAKQGIAAELPVKSPKKAVKPQEHTVFILVRDGQIPLLRRPNAGLLAGLWQPPMAEGHQTQKAAGKLLAEMGFQVLAMAPLPPARHVFTHIRWELRGWVVRVSGQGPADLRWFSPADIREQAAVPSAFEAYLGIETLGQILKLVSEKQ